jgi:DNA-binding PadR family transcriptional regulator
MAKSNKSELPQGTLDLPILKARVYSLTASGRRQLQEETGRWEMLSRTIDLMLKAT